MIEKVARAICATAFDGYDPDEMVSHKPPPDEATFEASAPEGYRDGEECWWTDDGEYFAHWKRWRLYEAQARAAIAAYNPNERLIKALEVILHDATNTKSA